MSQVRRRQFLLAVHDLDESCRIKRWFSTVSPARHSHHLSLTSSASNCARASRIIGHTPKNGPSRLPRSRPSTACRSALFGPLQAHRGRRDRRRNSRCAQPEIKQAAAFVKDLERTESLLRTQLALYRRVEGEIRRAVLRRFLYSLFCVIEQDQVIALAFMHQHQKPRARGGDQVLRWQSTPFSR